MIRPGEALERFQQERVIEQYLEIIGVDADSQRSPHPEERHQRACTEILELYKSRIRHLTNKLLAAISFATEISSSADVNIMVWRVRREFGAAVLDALPNGEAKDWLSLVGNNYAQRGTARFTRGMALNQRDCGIQEWSRLNRRLRCVD